MKRRLLYLPLIVCFQMGSLFYWDLCAKEKTISYKDMTVKVNYPESIVAGDPFDVQVHARPTGKQRTQKHAMVFAQADEEKTVRQSKSTHDDDTQFIPELKRLGTWSLPDELKPDGHKMSLTLIAQQDGPIKLRTRLISGGATSSSSHALHAYSSSCLACDLFAKVCPGSSVTFNPLEGQESGCRLVEVSNAVNGTTSMTATTFSYRASAKRPDPAVDLFTYTLEDAWGQRQTGDVKIELLCCTPCCDAFEVKPINVTVTNGVPIRISILDGVTGCDVALQSVGKPTNGGNAQIVSETEILYTPPEGVDIGTDSFDFSVTGVGQGGAVQQGSSVVRVAIDCTEPFIVRDKSQTVNPSGNFTFNALEGSSGCNLMFTEVTQGINGGTVVPNFTANTFTYFAQPVQPPGGLDSFNFTLTAEVPGGSPALQNTGIVGAVGQIGPQVQVGQTGTVFITIPCEQPFVINPIEDSVCEGESKAFDVTQGNSGCNLQLMKVSQPTNGGTVVANPVANTVVYTASVTPVAPVAPVASAVTAQAVGGNGPCPPFVPTQDNLATDTFTFTVGDNAGNETEAPAKITICCPEEFAVNPKSGTTTPGQCIVFDALKGNSGCSLRLNGVTQPIVGEVLADLINNTITFKAPETAAPGTSVNINYTLSDVSGSTATAPVTVGITAPVVA